METFCKDVIAKCSLDYENEQLKDMTKALTELIGRFTESMKEQRQGHNCQLKIDRVDQCGSMTEQTRITTNGIEYDYLAVVVGSTYFGHPCTRCELGGCVQVFSDYEKENELKSEDVKTAFHERLLDTIGRNCSKINCRGGCEYCITETKTGTLKVLLTDEFNRRVSHTKLKFRWMPHTTDSEGIRMCIINPDPYIYESKIVNYTVSNKPQYYIPPSERGSDEEMFSLTNPDEEDLPLKSDRVPIEAGLEIEVDFHAVLDLSPDGHKTNFNFESPRSCFLFPKSAKDMCGGWRISAYKTELCDLQQTSISHRQAYMIMKFVLEQVHGGIATYITSYHLKTGILHHVKECDSPCDSAGTCPSVSECVTDVLTFLSRCFQAQCLPNAQLGTDVIKTSDDLFIPSCPQFAKSHCESIGYILHVVCEILRADKNGYIEPLVNRFRVIRSILSDIAAVKYDNVEKFKKEFDKWMSQNKLN